MLVTFFYGRTLLSYYFFQFKKKKVDLDLYLTWKVKIDNYVGEIDIFPVSRAFMATARNLNLQTSNAYFNRKLRTSFLKVTYIFVIILKSDLFNIP